MDLPGLFTSSPEIPEKLYIAIVLTEQSIQSALWKVVNGEIITVKRSGLHAYQDEKECLVKVDESLQDLGQESENINQVIFGLQPAWVKGSDVAPDKQKLLDKITAELSLEAVGFVVITEAVIQHLLHIHPNLSALCLHLSSAQLSMTLVNQGKPVKSEHVGRSNDIVADVTEALARIQSALIPAQAIPAKFFVYSGDLSQEQLMNEEQLLIEQDWLSHGFLQPPVTEILSPALILEAVINQGGVVVAASEGLTASLPTPAPKDIVTENDSFGFDEVPFEEKGALNSDPSDELQNVVTPDLDERAVPVASTFGVPVTSSGAVATAVNAVPDDFSETEVPKESGKKKKLSLAMPSFKLPAFMTGSVVNGKKIPPHPFIAGGFILGLVVLVAASYLYLRLTSTVVIAIELASRVVAKEAVVTLNPQATSADPQRLILPASTTTKEFSAEATLPASGVTLVGEKAKGKVTLFNKTTSSKKFAAGTTLTSGKFQFTIDDEVTVASASVTVSGDSETKNYGKQDVNVTAVAIGAESNLTKDTELTIASFDTGTYAAAIAENLSGGSSREVRVVSPEDRTKLLSQLKAEILEKAKESFKAESGNGLFTLPTGNMTPVETTYSAAAGEEVESVSLALTADVEAMSYKLEDLMPLAEEILKSEVPENYELSSDVPNVLSSPVEQASSSALVKLNVNLTSKAKPVVIPDNWKAEVAGLGLAEATSKLQGKSEIEQVEFRFQPTFVSRLVPIMPAVERITIEVK